MRHLRSESWTRTCPFGDLIVDEVISATLNHITSSAGAEYVRSLPKTKQYVCVHVRALAKELPWQQHNNRHTHTVSCWRAIMLNKKAWRAVSVSMLTLPLHHWTVYDVTTHTFCLLSGSLTSLPVPPSPDHPPILEVLDIRTWPGHVTRYEWGQNCCGPKRGPDTQTAVSTGSRAVCSDFLSSPNSRLSDVFSCLIVPCVVICLSVVMATKWHVWCLRWAC